MIGLWEILIARSVTKQTKREETNDWTFLICLSPRSPAGLITGAPVGLLQHFFFQPSWPCFHWSAAAVSKQHISPVRSCWNILLRLCRSSSSSFTSHCWSSWQGRLCRARKYLGSPQKLFVHLRWDGQSLWLQHFWVSLKRTDFSKSPLEIVNRSLSSHHLSLIIPFTSFSMETYSFLRQMPKPMFSLSWCLKQLPSFPSPSSSRARLVQSESLLHHLKPVLCFQG